MVEIVSPDLGVALHNQSQTVVRRGL